MCVCVHAHVCVCVCGARTCVGVCGARMCVWVCVCVSHRHANVTLSRFVLMQACGPPILPTMFVLRLVHLSVSHFGVYVGHDQYQFQAEDSMVVLRKAHTRSAPSLSSLPTVALETVAIFVWLNRSFPAS